MRALLAVLTLALWLPTALGATPRIDSVTPNQGPIAGGTDVIVAGAGFAGASVRLDNVVITPTSQTDSEIRLRLPAHDSGYAVIAVRAGAGSAYGEYLYVPPRLEDLPAGSITTIAGIGRYSRAVGPAVNATVFPAGLAFDANGNLYVAEPGYDRVTRVRLDGQIELMAGNGTPSNQSGDGGPAVDAHVSFPLSLGVDPAGNLYLPDSGYRVRKVDALTGNISTIAGTGVEGSTGDNGPATQAQVESARHVTADAADVFFIEYDQSNVRRRHRIRRIHLADGVISAFAGTGTPGFSGDGGAAVAAQFDVGTADDGHLALDPAGNVYLADSANFRIRRIDRASGIISTFYTLPTDGTKQDFVGTVRSVAFDRAGNLYYAGSGRIVKVSPTGAFVTAWGNGTYALQVEGASARTSGLGHITGLAIAANGDVYFSDDAIARVRRIEIATDKLYTAAGIGPATIGETGPAYAAAMQACDVTVDRDGSLLVADSTLRVRRIDLRGNLTTVAGTGCFVGQLAPAPALQAVIAPVGIDVDANGEIEFAHQSTISHIDAAGILRDIAGHGAAADYTGDGGPATLAALDQAWDCVRDAAGNLVIADSNNNRIRRVDARTGIITTIVGNGGPVNGYERYGSGQSSGDGGPALAAAINTPYGVAFDAAGNLYLSERPAIRKVDLAGRISTFAPIANTTKLIFDRSDRLHATVTDGVFRLDASGNRTWLAGGPTAASGGLNGDGGAALQARILAFGQAAGLAIDYDGNLFFCDFYRIRAIRLAAPPSPPIIFAQPASRAFTAGATATLAFPANGASPLRYQWRRNDGVIVDSTTASLTLANFGSANTGIYTSVLTNNVGTATTSAIVVGLDTTNRVVGGGQVVSTAVTHPNGNVFDQVLVTGAAETITAGPGKVTRTSFIDLNDDIVQVEFSGAGTLSLVLEGASGPAAPVNYSQAVDYMKGHAGIVITGANETTNVSIFTVGRVNAFDATGRYNILQAPSTTNDPANNGSPLFANHATTNYDGVADLAFIAIASPTGKFGGLRAANASFWNTKGYVGVYAPDVRFTGPVNIQNINARSEAIPVLRLGGADGGTRITGGDMKQENNRPVQVSGITQLVFTAGATSANRALPAQTNRGRYEQNGADVTQQIVVNP